MWVISHKISNIELELKYNKMGLLEIVIFLSLFNFIYWEIKHCIWIRKWLIKCRFVQMLYRYYHICMTGPNLGGHSLIPNWPPILFVRWTLWGLHCQRPRPPPNPTSLQLHPQARAHRGGFSCPRWISRLPADHLWGQPRVQQVDVCRERTRRLLVSVRLMFWWPQDHRTWREGRITWSLNCRQYPGNIAIVVLSTFSLSDLTAFPSCSIKESVCSLVKRWLELLSLYLCITRK